MSVHALMKLLVTLPAAALLAACVPMGTYPDTQPSYPYGGGSYPYGSYPYGSYDPHCCNGGVYVEEHYHYNNGYYGPYNPYGGHYYPVPVYVPVPAPGHSHPKPPPPGYADVARRVVGAKPPAVQAVPVPRNQAVPYARPPAVSNSVQQAVRVPSPAAAARPAAVRAPAASKAPASQPKPASNTKDSSKGKGVAGRAARVVAN